LIPTEPGWTLRHPKVQPILKLDRLRLIGAGLLLENPALLLVRIFGGELGALGPQV